MSNTSNVTLEFLRKFSPSILKYTPIEVLTFGPLDYKLSVLTGSIIAFLSFLSLAGNFLMMMLYIKYKTLRTSSNKLVVTLTCSNTLMHIKSWILVVNGLAGGPILGRFGKDFMYFHIISPIPGVYRVRHMFWTTFQVQRYAAPCSIFLWLVPHCMTEQLLQWWQSDIVKCHITSNYHVLTNLRICSCS